MRSLNRTLLCGLLLAQGACGEGAPSVNEPGDSPAATGGGTNLGGRVDGSAGGANGGSEGPGGSAGLSRGPVDAAAESIDAVGGAEAEGGNEVVTGPVPTAANVITYCARNAQVITCDFHNAPVGATPGNYDVTVVLGGAEAAQTVVFGETHRKMLSEISTVAGEMQRFSFTVNVREPEGEPKPSAAQQPLGPPGLQLYFSGTSPALQAIGIAPAVRPTTLYIIGDSTTGDNAEHDNQQPPRYKRGWGQFLPQHLRAGVAVANYAVSGDGTREFLPGGVPELIAVTTTLVKAGDYVFIHIGQNDLGYQHVPPTQFRSNLLALIANVQAKSAHPVLMTQIAVDNFTGNNTLGAQHLDSEGVDFSQIIRQLATDQNVPLIDLETIGMAWLEQIGRAAASPFYWDSVHTLEAGADKYAGYVADGSGAMGGIKKVLPALADFVR